MLIIVTPLVVCILGLLMYVLASNGTRPAPVVARLGEIMFAAGLLVTLLGLGNARAAFHL